MGRSIWLTDHQMTYVKAHWVFVAVVILLKLGKKIVFLK